MTSKHILLIVSGVFLLAAAYFMVRGPFRRDSNANDLSIVYASTRAWLSGDNPYSYDDMLKAYRAGGGPDDSFTDPTQPHARRQLLALYPPTILVPMSPLAMLSLHTARLVWLLLNLFFFVALFLGLVKLAGWRLDQPQSLLLLLIMFLWAPIHSGFDKGQTTLATTAMGVVGIVALWGGRPWAAGVLIGLAAAIKPQVGGIFLFYSLLRGHWQTLASATVVIVAAFLGAVIPLGMRGFHWYSDLSNNYHQFFTADGWGNPTAANPYRSNLFNLDYPLNAILTGPLVTPVIMIFAVVVVIAASVKLLGSRRERDTDLLFLSVISALSLVVLYHRFYDAVLLLIPLVWLMNTAQRRLDRRIGIGALLLLPFLLSGAGMLLVMQSRGYLPAWLDDRWWWHGLILPHATWAATVLTAMLAYTLWTRRKTRY